MDLTEVDLKVLPLSCLWYSAFLYGIEGNIMGKLGWTLWGKNRGATVEDG